MKSEATTDVDESAKWDELRGALDEALVGLGEKDRRAVVLRFLEQRDYDEVASALGVSHDAAKQRVFRAVEKLRGRLAGKGVVMSAGALGTTIGARGVEAAPAGLAAHVAAAAAAGSASSAAVAGIAKGTVKVMAIAKAKAAVWAAAVALAITGPTTIVGMRLARAQAPTGGVAKAAAPVVPVADAPTKPNAKGAAAGKAREDWYPRFHAVYALAKGQVLKRVPPPFIDERWDYWKSVQPFAIPPEPGEKMLEKSFVLRWEGGRYKWEMASLPECSLEAALYYICGLRHVDTDGPTKLKILTVPGDFVFDDNSTVEQRVAAVEALWREQTGRRITIRDVRKEREVVVVRGTLKLPAKGGPVDERGRPIVELGIGEPLPPERASQERPAKPTSAKMAEVYQQLEDWFGMPVIDESGFDLSRVMLKVWRGDTKNKAYADWADTTLGMLAKQTGLEFERGRREMGVWEIAEEK